jgi:hypothetical protein
MIRETSVSGGPYGVVSNRSTIIQKRRPIYAGDVEGGGSSLSSSSAVPLTNTPPPPPPHHVVTAGLLPSTTVTPPHSSGYGRGFQQPYQRKASSGSSGSFLQDLTADGTLLVNTNMDDNNNYDPTTSQAEAEDVGIITVIMKQPLMGRRHSMADVPPTGGLAPPRGFKPSCGGCVKRNDDLQPPLGDSATGADAACQPLL